MPMSTVTRPCGLPRNRALASIPANRAVSHGSSAVRTKREANGPSPAWCLAFGVTPLDIGASVFVTAGMPFHQDVAAWPPRQPSRPIKSWGGEREGHHHRGSLAGVAGALDRAA